ncbi:hypothetical protein EHI48_17720 [Rhizobium sp. WSM1325]|nr:hypothetical protein EHI43_15840 [Rhizobium leguminosarum]RWY75048.1 hypothetical protein EHI48_17720 [Rhizobium leguminosarum]
MVARSACCERPAPVPSSKSPYLCKFYLAEVAPKRCAAELTALLDAEPRFVFETPSTDFKPALP